MPSFNPTSPAPQRRIIVKPQSPGKHHIPPPNLSPLLSPGTGRRRKDIGDYWLGKTLGKGSSGRVKLGIHKVSGEKVAIKIISKSHLATNASVERAVKREIAIMKLIHHPNIMSLLDVIDLSDSPNLYLILEYVQGGELFDYLVSQGRLSEPEARKYFQQIIFGLDYCHRHLICHRDLKPENLLLDKDKNIKIADFGMASLQPAGSLLETSCGSPHYASPEIVNGVPYNGSASDIWSCGIILYALLCGHLPFDDDNIRELLNKVKIGKYKMPDYVSSGARDLIQKILVIHPEKRLTMKQVQQHPWFTADPPINPSILPDPPTASEIGRPVSDASEIDDRLLETLKVLWTDLSSEEVLKALLNEEYNMQKVTYVLLQRHANNYWQTERDDDIRTAESPAKRRRPATICSAATTTTTSARDSLPGIDGMMHQIAGKERNVGDVDLPPPVPPKPIVIRADLIYNQACADASANLKSPRPPHHSPMRPPQHRIWRQPVPTFSPSPQRRPIFNPPPPSTQQQTETPPQQQEQQHAPAVYPPHQCCQHHHQPSIFNPPPPPSTPQQQQQHLSIAHMLSPRTPTRPFLVQPTTASSHHQHYHYPTQFQSPSQSTRYTSTTTTTTTAATSDHVSAHSASSSSSSSNNNHSNGGEPSKLNRIMHLWQRNKVEPVTAATNMKAPNKGSHRLSMPAPIVQPPHPQPQSPFHHRHQFHQPQQHDVDPTTGRAGLVTGTTTAASPMLTSASRVTTTPRQQGSPRLSSWLPGLFHFKQPKVCSIDCAARDEREAIGKIKQVLEECLDGTITERQDSEGNMRRKGEMVLPGNDTTTKAILLRFKVEVQLPSSSRLRMVRVNFIQQQGDAVALMTAVRMVQRTLELYEHEANLIATANGWIPQSSFS